MAGVQGASVIVTGTSGTVSRSTVVSLTVTSPNQSFTLALSSGTPQVSQGSSVNVTLTLTGSDGFNSPVTYTCTDPAPQSTCTGPSGVTASTSVSFLITTTAPTVAARQGLGASRIFYATLLPGLLGLVLTFSSRKRSLNGLRFVGLILALGLSTMWLASCGGGSGSTKNAGTPTGAYTITVSATTGGANPITGQTTFTLNVVH